MLWYHSTYLWNILNIFLSKIQGHPDFVFVILCHRCQACCCIKRLRERFPCKMSPSFCLLLRQRVVWLQVWASETPWLKSVRKRPASHRPSPRGLDPSARSGEESCTGVGSAMYNVVSRKPKAQGCWLLVCNNRERGYDGTCFVRATYYFGIYWHVLTRVPLSNSELYMFYIFNSCLQYGIGCWITCHTNTYHYIRYILLKLFQIKLKTLWIQ